MKHTLRGTQNSKDTNFMKILLLPFTVRFFETKSTKTMNEHTHKFPANSLIPTRHKRTTDWLQEDTIKHVVVTYRTGWQQWVVLWSWWIASCSGCVFEYSPPLSGSHFGSFMSVLDILLCSLSTFIHIDNKICLVGPSPTQTAFHANLISSKALRCPCRCRLLWLQGMGIEVCVGGAVVWVHFSSWLFSFHLFS